MNIEVEHTNRNNNKNDIMLYDIKTYKTTKGKFNLFIEKYQENMEDTITNPIVETVQLADRKSKP